MYIEKEEWNKTEEKIIGYGRGCTNNNKYGNSRC